MEIVHPTVTLMEVYRLKPMFLQLVMQHNWSTRVYSPLIENLFGVLIALSP